MILDYVMLHYVIPFYIRLHCITVCYVMLDYVEEYNELYYDRIECCIVLYCVVLCCTMLQWNIM